MSKSLAVSICSRPLKISGDRVPFGTTASTSSGILGSPRSGRDNFRPEGPWLRGLPRSSRWKGGQGRRLTDTESWDKGCCDLLCASGRDRDAERISAAAGPRTWRSDWGQHAYRELSRQAGVGQTRGRKCEDAFGPYRSRKPLPRSHQAWSSCPALARSQRLRLGRRQDASVHRQSLRARRG